MSDSYDPVSTATTAISFRKLDALQDAVAIYGKLQDGTPVAVLVAADGTVQTRRLSRSSDEIVIVGTDAQGVARPIVVDTLGRLSFRALSALASDPDSVRSFLLGPGNAQAQARADADGALIVADAAARASLASILGRFDVPASNLRDAITAALQATQPRSVANFPADYPDALTQARLSSILGQLDAKTGDVLAGIVAATQATQPRNVTNWPADFPDALTQARLSSILGQLDAKTGDVLAGIVSAIQATQPRSVSNFPADYPDALASSRLASILAQIDRSASEVWDVRSAAGAVTAAANNAGLTVALDLGPTGRTHVQRFISAGAGAVVSVQASRDAVTWRTVETLTFPTSPGGVGTLDGNGYRYIRVTSASLGVALEFEISAAR